MQIIEVKNQLVSTIALIDDENKILIGRRPVGKAFENLWEFPGGKVKKNETVEQALIRETKEEINISIDIGMGKHKWTVYTCDLTEQYIRINADYRS